MCIIIYFPIPWAVYSLHYWLLFFLASCIQIRRRGGEGGPLKKELRGFSREVGQMFSDMRQNVCEREGEKERAREGEEEREELKKSIDPVADYKYPPGESSETSTYSLEKVAVRRETYYQYSKLCLNCS